MAKIERIIKYGFYLLIFLLPWQTRLIWQDAFLNGETWEYGRFSLYGTQILLWLVLFLFFAWLFKNRQLKKLNFQQVLQRLKNPAVFIYWLIIGFVLIAGLSVVWSLNSELAYYRWFILVQAGAMMAMILLFNFQFKKIAIAWVGSAAIQGVFAIWQFFAQYIPANKWFGLALHLPSIPGSIILQTDIERWLRAYGSLPHPNVLAGFLVIGILFLLYLAFAAVNQGQRSFVLVSLLAIIPALFLSFSRSAWIALIVSLAILSFWLYRRKEYLWNQTFLKIFFLILLIVIILGINLSGPLATRLQADGYAEEVSIQLRLDMNQQAWQMIKDNPWRGVGIGNYTLAVYQRINATWPGWYYQPVHNIYLLVLTETGIFGAIFFGLFLILLIWFLSRPEGAVTSPRLRLEKNEGETSTFRLQGIIIFLALFSILIISLFDHYFWTIEFGVLVFWLIIGFNLKRLKKVDTS